MQLKPLALGSCLLFFGLAPAESVWSAEVNKPVTSQPQQIELLEHRVNALDANVAARLEAQEKLVQAKADQVSAIAQVLEGGRKDLDWWLSTLAVFLALVSVLAMVIPVFLQKRQSLAFEAEVGRIRETFDRLHLFERDTKSEMGRALDDLRAAKEEIRGHLQTAEREASRVRQFSEEAEEALRTQIDKTPGELSKAADQLRQVKDSPEARLITKALEFVEAGKMEEAVARWRALIDLDPESESHWFNLGYSLQKMAEEDGARKIAYLEEASFAYATVARIKPDSHGTWYNWGNALASWGRSLPASERPAKFAEAIEKYAEAVRIKSDKHEALSNWGNTLAEWARALPVAEQPAKFAEAEEKYAEAVRLKPDKYEAWYNWGNTLASWAKILPGVEAAAKFEEASKKFAEVVRLKPDMFEAWNNWGNTLANWARALPKAEQPAKFAEAEEKYAEAARIEQGQHKIWKNWGDALFDWALALPEAEQPTKFAEAGGKFAEAVRIKPDQQEAWAGWGHSLLEVARKCDEPERTERFVQAKKALLKAEGLEEGSGAYNLVCVAALMGAPEEARVWLEKAWVSDESIRDCTILTTDPDLNSLRELDWFREFLAANCPSQ